MKLKKLFKLLLLKTCALRKNGHRDGAHARDECIDLDWA